MCNKESWFQQERLNSIMEMISSSGRVTVKELSEAFSISLVTIRKDLKQLEKEGKVHRTHGGAISSEEMLNHVAFDKRKVKNLDRKIRIGEKAASLVSSGDIIFIGASTTTVEMCQFLAEIKNLTVVTNSIEIAYNLGKSPYCNVVIIGGGIKKETLSVIDSDIEKTFSRWQIDMAFFGGWGFSPKDGMTDVPGVLIQQKKVIASRSKINIGLIDSSKVGKGSLDTFISADKLDILITNSDVNQDFIEAMDRIRTKLLLA